METFVDVPEGLTVIQGLGVLPKGSKRRPHGSGTQERTPTIVNEFVKKIIVHAPDKSSGHRRQKIQIIWNFVGELKQDEDKQTIERERKSRTA